MKKFVYKREPWQGIAIEEDKDKELEAPCGCIFRAEPYYWGSNIKKIEHGRAVLPKPSNYFWYRVKDCPRVKELNGCIP